MGSEALSRVPGREALPFPPPPPHPPRGGASRTPGPLEGNTPLISLGFSKHFNFENDLERLTPPCGPPEIAFEGGSKDRLRFSPLPLLVLLDVAGRVGLSCPVGSDRAETWALLDASGHCHLEESGPWKEGWQLALLRCPGSL